MTQDQIPRLARSAEEERVLQDLRIFADRIYMIAERYGLKPPPAIFTLKSDQQILDDIVYAGLPRHYRHWSYGKAAMRGMSGHVFEFALTSVPAEIALGSTNRLTMQARVMLHAWLGHEVMDGNAIFRETDPASVIQKFAQDELFVDSVIEKWGHERYEWYMDAARALQAFSGWLPTNRDLLADPMHRRMLEDLLKELEMSYRLAKTEDDRLALEREIEGTVRLLKCHPIVPTDDLLAFLADDDNTPQLPWEAHELVKIVRWEWRFHQAFMRTRYMHEGWSNWVDGRMMYEPELDLVGLGFGTLLDVAREGSMHESWPTRWYNDVYSFGAHLWDYIFKTTASNIGTEMTEPFTRLQLGDDGHIINTAREHRAEVEKWDISYMLEVLRTYTDNRFFRTFITDGSMEMLNKKAVDWVRRQMQQVNKRLKDGGWNEELIFDPLPETLEDLYEAISIWYQQRIMSERLAQWFGVGSPPFPIHEAWLEEMLQIVQIVAEWDEDKHAFKRQMLLWTEVAYLPDIRLVDSGRFSESRYTLRHEFDPDFGPLAQSDARDTLRMHFRFSGPCQLLTWEILVDSFGRPSGPPRPYLYLTDNGETVKERWL